MILLKALLAGSLLTSSLPGIVSTVPKTQATAIQAEVQPRLSGTANSGWLTASSGNSQVIVNYTYEFATNRIVYVNSIVSFKHFNSGSLAYLAVKNYTISGNTAVINIQYTLDAPTRIMRTYTDTFYLTV